MTDVWTRKAIKALASTRSENPNITITRKGLTLEDKEQLSKELLSSTYTLDGLEDFINGSSMMHSFRCGICIIDIICKRVGKKLAQQVERSLYRANALGEIFGVRKNVHVVLVPFNIPRVKPGKDEYVEPRHVNGGYTYTNRNTVYIYRLEEWPKVMLHELIHHVPIIQGTRWTQGSIQKLYAVFGIDDEGCPKRCSTALEPTEAVVEAWAIFLHTAFMSHETGRDFYGLMSDELTWNERHISWVLEKKRDDLWKEGTHVFSYIVLRGILLRNLEEFLSLQMPYRPRDLCSIWVDSWKKYKMEKKAGKGQTGRTLRMSRYGDI